MSLLRPLGKTLALTQYGPCSTFSSHHDDVNRFVQLPRASPRIDSDTPQIFTKHCCASVPTLPHYDTHILPAASCMSNVITLPTVVLRQNRFSICGGCSQKSHPCVAFATGVSGFSSESTEAQDETMSGVVLSSLSRSFRRILQVSCAPARRSGGVRTQRGDSGHTRGSVSRFAN